MENKNGAKRFIKPLIGVIILVVLALCSPLLGFDLSRTIFKFSLQKFVTLVAMVILVLLITFAVRLILGAFKPKSHRAQTVITILRSVLSYAAALVILCWGLSILGVNVATIATSVGIIALIVGFGAESLIADVVTGIFMLFENQYNVGDIVEVNGFRGTVSNIGIRTTSITDPSDNVKIINNSMMVNILNRSDNLSRAVCDIGIPYATDLEKLEKQIPAMLEEICAAHADGEDGPLFREPLVYCGVQALADSAIVLRFAGKVEEKDIYTGARALNHDILLAFRRVGVECPFPQVDVHNC